MRDQDGNVYAYCPDVGRTISSCAAAGPGGFFLVSPRSFRLEAERTGPPTDLKGTALALVLAARLYPEDRRPVARCPRHGGALVDTPPELPS